MIAIVNVGEAENGLHRYEVRINQRVITTFEHKRRHGLTACLEKAARAVQEYEQVELLEKWKKRFHESNT